MGPLGPYAAPNPDASNARCGRRLGTRFPAGLGLWDTSPAPPLESAVTFAGIVHAPIPWLGGDWSSRVATAPGATATDRVPP